MLYVRALEKVLNERDIKKSQYAQAKRVSEAALQEIRLALQNQQVSADGNGRSTPDENIKDENFDAGDKIRIESSSLIQNEDRSFKIDSEKFFIPFEMSCQGDSPKVTIAALDGLQKLLAHGQITGNYANPANPNKKLIDRIVETICSCFEGSETDEGVELQIIKALLTIVTSQHVQIHEGTILLTLRTCYNIYLSTKNTVNQTTARAMLTQMLHSIFTRMEIALDGKSEEICDYVGENNNNFGVTTLEILENVTSPLKDWERENITWYRNLDFSKSSSSSITDAADNNEEITDSQKDEMPQFSNVRLRIQSENAQRNDLEDDIAQECAVFSSDFDVNKISNTNFENETEKISSEDIIIKSNENDLQNPIEIPQNPIKQEVSLNSVTSENATLGGTASANINNENISSKFIHVLQKDAFLTFWAICKLAIKSSSSQEGSTELIKSLETNSKILSFQLLKSIMENCGTVFKTSPIFITAIKQYLCSAMSQAAVSPILEVFQINLDLLGYLIQKFRTILRDEIEKLCAELLFPVLELSSNSSEYKLLALGVINKICGDVKCLVELYTNYDAPGSSDARIFERIIRCVCKISVDKPVQDSSGLSPAVVTLRILAIESLATILSTMASCLKKNEAPKFYVQENTETINIQTETVSHKSSDNINTQVSEFIQGLLSLIGNIPNSADVPAIDLLVQKFAQRICDCSYSCQQYEKIESADSVYALVYSAISLIGDLSYKSQGKNRISKEQFSKMNNGINGCEPLTEMYLNKVYDEIEAYLTQHNSSSRKRQIDVKSHNVVNNAKRLIAVVGLQQSAVSTEKQVRSIRRMFKVMGKSVLIALLGTLTECDDTTISDVCLTGLQSAIHIASVLNLKNERDSFVQALSRLTLASLKEIKSKQVNAMVITSKTSSMTTTENGVTKTIITTTTETRCRNVDIIQTLLNVAINEGNHLGNAWLETLKCISQLEAAQLMGTNRNSRSRSSSPNPNAQPPPNPSKSWYSWAGSFVPTFWDSSGNKLDMASVKESMGNLVNEIFVNSATLDGNGIVDFFKALCQVSLIEITHPESPRSFVYEKLFEVAHINMDRPSLQWSDIWQVLADYFSHLACSSDEDVSFFAIDSVTKLAVHLLEKERLGNFRFQNHLLLPFETIIKNTPFHSTREYVLESISKIVQANSAELRSGWRTILKILEMNIYNGDENNCVVSFLMIQNILDMFEKGEVNLIDSFEEIIRSLKDFAFHAPSQAIQSESMDLIKKIAKLVHDKPELLLRDLGDRKVDRIWLKGWSPIFTQLSNVVINAELGAFDEKMQATALSVLFELIKTYGNSLTTSWWKSLFEILFRIFNKLKFHEENIVADESNTALTNGNYSHYFCYYYVQFAIVDTFIRFFDIVGSMLLDDILKELQWCVTQDHEQISLSGVQCLHQIIRLLEGKFTPLQWNTISTMGQNLLRNSIRTGSSNSLQSYKLETETGEEKQQCNSVVQLEILKLVKSVLFTLAEQKTLAEPTTESEKDTEPISSCDVLRSILEDNQLFKFLEILEESILFKKSLDEGDIQLTDEAASFISHKALSFDILLRLLFQMYRNRSWSSDYFENIEMRLQNVVSCALKQFTIVCSKDYTDALTDVVESCLTSICNLPNNKFKMFTSNYYSCLCDMLEMELKPTLTVALCKYFLQIGCSVDIIQGTCYTNKLLDSQESQTGMSEKLSSSVHSEKSISFQINYDAQDSFKNSV